MSIAASKISPHSAKRKTESKILYSCEFCGCFFFFWEGVGEVSQLRPLLLFHHGRWAVGPFLDKSEAAKGNKREKPNHNLLPCMKRSGRGPVFLDLKGALLTIKQENKQQGEVDLLMDSS